MMTATNFNMRIDSHTKEQFTAVLADYGLTMPQAIKLFANQVIKTKQVPLSFDWANNTPNEVTQQAMQEALNRTDFSESYATPDEALQAIQEIANA